MELETALKLALPSLVAYKERLEKQYHDKLGDDSRLVVAIELAKSILAKKG